MAVMDLPQDHQDKFDQYVTNALNIIHDKKVTPQLVARMKREEPRDAIGDIAVDIAERIDSTAEAKNVELTANAIINGLNVVVGELCEVAAAAGIEPLDDEEKYQAYSWAVSRYLKDLVARKKITKKDLEFMKSQVEQEDMAQNPQQPMPQGQPQQQPPQGQQPMSQEQPQSQQPQASQRQPMPQQKPGILGGM